MPPLNWLGAFCCASTSQRRDEGGERNQGNFDDGAWVQEAINAVELSHYERRWVDLPLPR